eukprot:m.33918 g.33918  ORF g.33918 m.33918 type:complete len:216 (-) comp9697_c0_seq1:785-1432(-)
MDQEFADKDVSPQAVMRVPPFIRLMENGHLGGGAQGTVVAAEDLRTGTCVALKRVINPFQSLHSALRVTRELKILDFCDHPNIVKLLYVGVTEDPYCGIVDVLHTTEKLDMTLRQLIDSELLLVRVDCIDYIMVQVARSLQYLAAANIAHRDIKPSNICLTHDLTVKLIDFGLSRKAVLNNDASYIQARNYRAPEVQLGYASPSSPKTCGVLPQC